MRFTRNPTQLPTVTGVFLMTLARLMVEFSVCALVCLLRTISTSGIATRKRSRPGTDDRWLPIYFLDSSGTPGSPTTVVGKYDHLIYYADPLKRCEIQNTAASLVSPWNDPGNRAGIGCYARSYQRWINFYLNTSNVPSYPDRGSVVCNDAHNCTFRKIVFRTVWIVFVSHPGSPSALARSAIRPQRRRGAAACGPWT